MKFLVYMVGVVFLLVSAIKTLRTEYTLASLDAIWGFGLIVLCMLTKD